MLRALALQIVGLAFESYLFTTSTLLILAGAEQWTRTPLFWKPGFLLVADTLLPTPNSTLVEPSLRQVTMAAW